MRVKFLMKEKHGHNVRVFSFIWKIVHAQLAKFKFFSKNMLHFGELRVL